MSDRRPKTRVVSVEAPFRDVLIDFARKYRRLPTLRFAQPTSGRWETFSFDGYVSKLARRGAALRLQVAAQDENFDAFYDLMRVRNKPLSLVLADGSEVSAELAHMKRLGEYAEIELHQWALRTDRAPLFWLGRLEGRLPSFGNLRIAESGDGWSASTRGAFCFCGQYTWYIVPPDESGSRVLVLDSRGTTPERERLLHDFLALQFVVGGALRLDHIVGSDLNGDVLAAMSLGGLARSDSRYRPPLGQNPEASELWAPEFFRRIANRIQSDGVDPLIIPFTAYLDAQAEHLDSAYLKTRVALRSFAKRIGERSARNEVVGHGRERTRDADAELGPDGSRSMTEAEGDEPPTLQRVLDSRGLRIPSDVQAELSMDGSVGDDFLMNSVLEYDLDRDVRRVELLQTLLVAFVADHVGYTGPIGGYDVAENGDRTPPPWWPVGVDANHDLVDYIAERALSGPKPKAVPMPGSEHRLLMSVVAIDEEHLLEIKEDIASALTPQVVALDHVGAEFAEGARDEEFMLLALEQARLSRTEPDRVTPKVGAVVVLRGEVIATGFRGEFRPGDHAEYTALELKLPDVDLSEATVYTTLEPCTFRHPPKVPCAERLIVRKVRRVVMGTLDPNPQIKGEGALRLSHAGVSIQLATPTVMRAIEKLNAEFTQQHRPK